MKLLLKQLSIEDPSSPFHQQIKDILIEQNQIIEIADAINGEGCEIITFAPKTIVSKGWIDLFCACGDPGYEHKESFTSLSNTASAGGFTHVFTLPNNKPTTSNKGQVSYVLNNSKEASTYILPLGAASKNIEGKELAEMYDMYQQGAVAFSAGLVPMQSSALLLKALQYVKAFNGVIIQMPIDTYIGKFGLMNEGVNATKFGLPGIPAIGEHIMLQRDIALLQYTESKLHITGITTAKSVQLIKQAKAAGLNITCSTTPNHLFFTDAALENYDTHVKLNPPLRTEEDRLALIEAVLDGTIDCISSHHQPHEWDAKICEFEYAQFGAIGLQTAYAAVKTAIPSISNSRINELFNMAAASVFSINMPSIQVGSLQPSLTFFNANSSTMLNKVNNKSKAANSPFLDLPLNGKVVGTYNKGFLYLNN